MTYRDFKDLPRRTASDKLLHNKAFDIAENPKYNGYHRGLASMVYKFFDRKIALLADESASSGGIKNKNMPDQQRAEELHKPIIRKIEKRKVHSSFIDNIWAADLANMSLISNYNNFCFMLCVIDIYSKYAWIVLLKDKKSLTITNAFQKILDELGCKPNIIWVDKRSEFYNRSTKSWLQDNDIEMPSARNKGKYFVTERFIRTLKHKL